MCSKCIVKRAGVPGAIFLSCTCSFCCRYRTQLAYSTYFFKQCVAVWVYRTAMGGNSFMRIYECSGQPLLIEHCLLHLGQGRNTQFCPDHKTCQSPWGDVSHQLQNARGKTRCAPGFSILQSMQFSPSSTLKVIKSSHAEIQRKREKETRNFSPAFINVSNLVGKLLNVVRFLSP